MSTLGAMPTPHRWQQGATAVLYGSREVRFDSVVKLRLILSTTDKAARQAPWPGEERPGLTGHPHLLCALQPRLRGGAETNAVPVREHPTTARWLQQPLRKSALERE